MKYLKIYIYKKNIKIKIKNQNIKLFVEIKIVLIMKNFNRNNIYRYVKTSSMDVT